jgi:hypothetical protein
MPLEGTITFGAWFGSQPVSSCLLIGVDGREYIAGRTALTIFVSAEWRVGDVRSETIVKEITSAAFAAEFATRQPSAGAMTASGYVLPVQGTPYFMLPGAYLDGGTARQQCGFLLYKITDASTITPVGSIALKAGINTGPTVGGVAYGAGVLASDPGFVYVVVEGGYVSSFTNEVLLLRLPVSETNITNLTNDAINTYQTKLATTGASHAFVGPRPGERTDSGGNLYTIVPDPLKDVGLIRRVGLAATPAVFYAAVDIAEDLGDHGETTEPAYTGSYITDVSTDFGMPWADIGNHLDLSASGDDHDDYTTPSHLGNGEVVFMRSDSANTSQAFGRRFIISGASSITSLGTFQFTHNNESIATFIQALDTYRLSTNEIVTALRDDFRWIFGSHTISSPSVGAARTDVNIEGL